MRFQNIEEVVKNNKLENKGREKHQVIPAQHYLRCRGKYWEHAERKLLNTYSSEFYCFAEFCLEEQEKKNINGDLA